MSELKQLFDDLDRASDKLEHYFSLYEKWFSPWINKSPKILEIGVQNGGDTEMWLKFFGPGTEITGVDIDPRCISLSRPGINVIIGDQGDPCFWDTFSEKDFDIIIDDGSHDNDHQILTLIKTFGLLKDGGLYWCEDCLTSYHTKRKGGGVENPQSFIEFSKVLVDVLHHHHFGQTTNKLTTEVLDLFYETTQGVHFYDCIVVLEKGPRFQFNRLIKEAKNGAPRTV